MGVFSDALRYPTNRQDGWTNPVAVGGILHFFSNFLLPYPLVLGYYLRVLDRTIGGEPEPPRFDGGWGGLYLDGLKVMLVTAILLVVPWLFGVILLSSMNILFGNTSGDVGGVLLFTAIVLVMFWYVVPASLANLGYEGRLFAAFSVRGVVGALTKQEYFVSWVLGTALFVGLTTVFSVVVIPLSVLIPPLGFLVFLFFAPGMTFFASTSAFYLYGRGFSRARGITPETIRPEPEFDATVGDGTEQGTKSDSL